MSGLAPPLLPNAPPHAAPAPYATDIAGPAAAVATATPDPIRTALDDLLLVTLDKAKAGETYAAEVSRLLLEARRRAVRLDLPPIVDAASIARAHAVVIAETAADNITPLNGLRLATMLEYRRRAIEMHEIEPILQALNEANAADRKAAGRRR